MDKLKMINNVMADKYLERYKQESAEARRAYQRAYHARNRQKINDNHRKWRENNRQAWLEAQARYNEKRRNNKAS